MAYDSSKENREVLGSVEKNDKGDRINVSKITIQGNDREYVDIRLMYTPDGGDELRPTQKGLRFDSEILLSIVKPLLEVLTQDELKEIHDEIADKLSDESDTDEGSESGSDEPSEE